MNVNRLTFMTMVMFNISIAVAYEQPQTPKSTDVLQAKNAVEEEKESTLKAEKPIKERTKETSVSNNNNPKATETREIFRPSEKISEDLSVSFPIDI